MRPLTQDDRVAAFRAATRALVRWHGDELAEGATDERLEALLVRALGIFGGSCGPGEMHITHQGAGLKIWASWGVHNHVVETPIFQGQATVRMAREVYGIPDPADPQQRLI